jgi:hypothetical protein
MATRAELEILWGKVQVHLEAAARLLPKHPRVGDDGGTIENYRNFLAHNELGLALDELEALGEANEVSESYWRELASAADLMELEIEAARCRSRLVKAPG